MVSIVVINYQDKVRVGRAIESALRQTWQDKEVIVVDDGSDQETRDIYNNYKVDLVQLERDDETARTPSRARNAGIKKATGDYICFLDSDNYYSTTFVEDLVKYNSDVAFCNWQIIGLENYTSNIETVWDFKKPILENYLRSQHLDHQCLLIKRAYLDKVGYYDERLPRSQDCDLIVRLILGKGGFQHIPKCGFFFEKHEKDQSKKIASVYGKTLWTLKNNINVSWLQGWLNNPGSLISHMRAINDFVTHGQWKDDYEGSDFKKIYEQTNAQLWEELKEKVDGKVAVS